MEIHFLKEMTNLQLMYMLHKNEHYLSKEKAILKWICQKTACKEDVINT